MVDTKTYWKENKRRNRLIDKELGKRYRSWEQAPGESYQDFKRRLTGKTVGPDDTPKL